MPHLSPMSWIMIPTMFWLLLMSLAIYMWFSPITPMPQSPVQTPQPPFTSWPWN